MRQISLESSYQVSESPKSGLGQYATNAAPAVITFETLLYLFHVFEKYIVTLEPKFM